jgi:hypothetical protein
MNAQLKPAEPVIADGLHTDIPADVYYTRQLDVASNSGLTILDERSPAHYRYWVEHPEADRQTDALVFGNAFDCATLEPALFGDRYAVLPGDAPRDLRYLRNAGKKSDTTKAAIDWWDAFDAANSGRTFLTRDDYDRALAMGRSLRAYEMAFTVDGRDIHVTAGELFDACMKQVTIYWTDEETGVRCKARLDLLEPDIAFAGDLKSARDASRAGFSRAINAHRYHVQAAGYVDGCRASGYPLKSFAFFPVEKDAPYVPASWHVDAPAEQRGWDIRQRSLRKLATCLRTGRWPGHTTTVEAIGIPAFGFYDADKDGTP